MLLAQRFRVNTPDVVHETIEGEAVIVNLSNGMYYSVDRAGADIWALIESGMSLPHIVTALADRYTGDRADMEEDVAAFLAQLHEEQLIVPDDGTATDEPPRAESDAPGAYRPRFETPVLQRYTDMEDLLLLDPIHEAEEQGALSDRATGT